YGLKNTIRARVLEYTYGVRIFPKWTEDDPLGRKVNDRIYKFHELAKRGTCVDEYSATYCDEPGMRLLGTFVIELPDTHLGLNRTVEYTFFFGKMNIHGIAKNMTNGNIYNACIELDYN
ncbi:8553_t:CDS:2, partial [Acaulospora morrowiae]